MPQTNSSKTAIRKTAIIGAGIGGLTCGRQLTAAGHCVTVFDKSRGVGGRLSTRRGEDGIAFDHGAQYFTVKDPAMQLQVDRWVKDKTAAVWDVRIGALRQGQWTPVTTHVPRYIGAPAMNAIGKSLAAGLDVQRQTRIVAISREGSQWRLQTAAGDVHAGFDTLLLNAPAPQSAELTRGFAAFCSQIAEAVIAPAWAAMVAFEEPLPLPWDAAFVEDSALSWVARNSSKPGRPAEYDCWVLHGSSAWSQQNLEEPASVVQQKLLAAFWKATGHKPQQHAALSAHRWRYALPVEPLASHCLFDAQLQLGACGDWCGGPRVEGAYLSGLALAGQVLQT